MELRHPFLHLRFGIAPRLVHIALGIVLIALRAVCRRLGAGEPAWRNPALDIGIISRAVFRHGGSPAPRRRHTARRAMSTIPRAMWTRRGAMPNRKWRKGCGSSIT